MPYRVPPAYNPRNHGYLRRAYSVVQTIQRFTKELGDAERTLRQVMTTKLSVIELIFRNELRREPISHVRRVPFYRLS
jgi:hypothetical protein